MLPERGETLEFDREDLAWRPRVAGEPVPVWVFDPSGSPSTSRGGAAAIAWFDEELVVGSEEPSVDPEGPAEGLELMVLPLIVSKTVFDRYGSNAGAALGRKVQH